MKYTSINTFFFFDNNYIKSIYNYINKKYLKYFYCYNLLLKFIVIIYKNFIVIIYKNRLNIFKYKS